jgi:hypothetical protein
MIGVQSKTLVASSMNEKSCLRRKSDCERSIVLIAQTIAHHDEACMLWFLPTKDNRRSGAARQGDLGGRAHAALTGRRAGLLTAIKG